MVIAVFLIAAVLFRPLAGKWLDQFNKRNILLIAVTFFLFSCILYFFVKSLIPLLMLRFIHGITFGIASTATGAIVAFVIPENRKGEGIGYYALSYNMAMFFGPFFGLFILNKYNFTVLILFLLIFSCLSFLAAANIRINKVESKQKSHQGKVSFWHTIIEVNAVPSAFTVMFLSFAFSGFLTFIPIYASELKISGVAGYFYVIYAIMMVLSRPVIGRIFDRYNEQVVIYPGILLYTIGLILLSLAQSPFLFLLSAAIIGVGFGSLSPCLQSIAVKSAANERSGLATATFLTFFDIGVGFGSSVLGWIVSETSFKFMYFGSSLIVCFSAFAYFILYHRKKKSISTIESLNEPDKNTNSL
jgi:MFS family permease